MNESTNILQDFVIISQDRILVREIGDIDAFRNSAIESKLQPEEMKFLDSLQGAPLLLCKEIKKEAKEICSDLLTFKQSLTERPDF